MQFNLTQRNPPRPAVFVADFQHFSLYSLHRTSVTATAERRQRDRSLRFWGTVSWHERNRAGQGAVYAEKLRLLQRAGALGQVTVGGSAHYQANNMIVLFADLGLQGPYTGQMKAVLHQLAPAIPVIDLFADAPVANPKASAYLLAAYAEWFAAGTVFLSVVDPGVGGTRPSIVLEAEGRWYVGPGNGLFELVQRGCAHPRPAGSRSSSAFP